MATSSSGSSSTSGSAKIYAFPPRGRFALREQHDEFQSIASVRLPRDVKIVSGSGWYHDAAIQDAEPTRKN
jgi:hypothetical protein